MSEDSTPDLIRRLEEMEVVEHVSSTYSYHLRHGKTGPALCGSTGMMQTAIPVSAWGVVMPHIRERYCKKCAALAGLTATSQP